MHKVQLRMVLQKKLQCRAIPRGAVARIISIVKEELLPLADIPYSLGAGYQVMSGVLEEPLCAVVNKAVVDLVTKCGTVVVQVYQVPWQVNPLPPLFISVGKYLVA